LAAVPTIGRANRVDGVEHPEADLTRELYEQYANQIFRYCLHQLGSREEAEDAVQSTFLNAFRGLRRGVVPELESAWLFKIAHNVCLSRRRSSWRRGRIESPTDFEVVEELTPAPQRRADELIGLQDVLEQMPESQRRAILLREWQGLSYREIAAELDVSQAAVETLIFRARRALATGLEQPPERPRRRVSRAADLGNLLAGLKSLLLGGGAAMKVAATVAVVGAASVAVAGPVAQHRHHTALVQSKPVAHARPAPAASVRSAPAAARLIDHSAAPIATALLATPVRRARKPVQPPGRVKHLAGIAAAAPKHSRGATQGPAWKAAPPASSHGKAVRGAAAAGKTAHAPTVNRGQAAKASAPAHRTPVAHAAKTRVHPVKAKPQGAHPKAAPATPPSRPVHPLHPAQPAASSAVDESQGQGQAKINDNGKGQGT
jgi:RNA polymerase sigma factor (sigma-70 family)